MADITKIPDEELAKDLVDSYKDIRICEIALARGITTYDDKPEGYVQQRLDVNKHFVLVIQAEQKRRLQEKRSLEELGY